MNPLDDISFAYPMRPWTRIKPTPDALFLDAKYKKEWGSWHRGIDLNGIGGGDTDLGLPIQSMFPGEIVEIAGKEGWGACVLIRAEPWVRDLISKIIRMPLEVLDIQYAHLHQISVFQNQLVNAGDHIGSMGDGRSGINWSQKFTTRYAAHLHLEARHKSVACIVPQKGMTQEFVKESCFNPMLLFNFVPLSETGNVIPRGRMIAPVRLSSIRGKETKDDVVVANRVHDKFYLT